MGCIPFLLNETKIMRKTRQEITDPLQIEDILSRNVLVRLALNDSPVPYLVPLNYGYSQGCLYMHSAPEGKKISLLKLNPLVCFEVEDQVAIVPDDQACKWSTRYRSVIGTGSVDIITDAMAKERGLAVIMASHGAPGLTGFDPHQISRMILLVLHIESLTAKQSSNWI